MLFGAIAGTVPDLDVLLSLWYKDDLSEIALHYIILFNLIFAL